MVRPPPTTREWEHLTRFGDHEWPLDWEERRDARERWRPAVETICVAHGLRGGGPIEPAAGSNLAVVLDDTVLKIFARRNPVWFDREVEALHVLESFPAALAPRLLAVGEVEHEGTIHPYLVMERLKGAPLRTRWAEMTPDDRASIARQLGPVVRAVHAVPVAGLAAFGTSPDEWVARMRARSRLCRERCVEEGMPARLVAEVDRFLDEHLPSITADFTPTLVHADVIGGNVLVERRGADWHVTGLVDWGDVEVGPVDYEWVSVCHKAFRRDKTLIAAFFGAYGVPFPFSDAAIERLRVYTLLHRFSIAPQISADPPELETLADLFVRMGPIGRGTDLEAPPHGMESRP